MRLPKKLGPLPGGRSAIRVQVEGVSKGDVTRVARRGRRVTLQTSVSDIACGGSPCPVRGKPIRYSIKVELKRRPVARLRSGRALIQGRAEFRPALARWFAPNRRAFRVPVRVAR